MEALGSWTRAEATRGLLRGLPALVLPGQEAPLQRGSDKGGLGPSEQADPSCIFLFTQMLQALGTVLEEGCLAPRGPSPQVKQGQALLGKPRPREGQQRLGPQGAGGPHGGAGVSCSLLALLVPPHCLDPAQTRHLPKPSSASSSTPVLSLAPTLLPSPWRPAFENSSSSLVVSPALKPPPPSSPPLALPAPFTTDPV